MPPAPRSLLFALPLLASWLAPRAGQAFSLSKDPEDPASRVSIRVTDDFRFKYYLVPALAEDDPLAAVLDVTDYPVLLNRLTVSGGPRWLTAGVQVDALLAFPGEERSLVEGQDPPGRGRPQGWLTPEKFYVQARHRVVQGEIGDTYAVLGRGLALALIKNPGIDVDTSVRGGQVRVTTDPFELTVLGGLTNPQDVSMESANQAVQSTPGDIAAGAQVTVRPVRAFALSALASHFQARGTFADPEAGGFTPLGTAVGGALAAQPFDGNLDVYAEGVGYLYGDELREIEPALDEGGNYALYLSATGLVRTVTILGEFKRSRHANEFAPTSGVSYLAYTRPPTLELEDQITEDASFTVASDDLWGGHLRVAGPVKDGTVVHADAAVFVDRDAAPGQRDHEVVVHGYGGFERHFAGGHHLIVQAGYRRDIGVPLPEGGTDFGDQDLFHGDVTATVVLGRGHVLENRTRLQRFAFRGEEGLAWVNLDALFQWGFKGKYFVAGTLGYTDDPTRQNLLLGGIRGNLAFSQPEGGLPRSLFGGIELIARPVQELQLKAFAGATKGGIVCSGGQCRVLPGFQGFRVEALTSF